MGDGEREAVGAVAGDDGGAGDIADIDDGDIAGDGDMAEPEDIARAGEVEGATAGGTSGLWLPIN
jgi:hypothetical protein